MPDRDRIKADKGGKISFTQIALDPDTVNRIRPIQNNEFNTLFCRGLHCKGHGVYIGIKPGTVILYIGLALGIVGFLMKFVISYLIESAGV